MIWDFWTWCCKKCSFEDYVIIEIPTKPHGTMLWLTVSWKPNRRCTFRYLGNQQFIVEATENSKLKVGNTFSCSVFILGAPLYLTDLKQGDNAPVAFVAGKKDGLCEIKILSSAC